jgi:hypothetical protein
MKSDLNKLRTAFPSWPSELDVARNETSWAVMAQQFYSAACVLHNEMRTVLDRMHSEKGLVLTEAILMRSETLIPTLFCMAFSLELAAKAATICKTQGADIEHGKKLPFTGHYVSKINDDFPELSLSDTEKDCLKQAEEIIANGKYPTGIKPRKDKSTFTAPNLEHFMGVLCQSTRSS